MENLLLRLRQKEVLVGDGALGTLLMQRGLKHGEPPESFNLTRPEILEEIALMYLEAGAQIVSTNTFGASPLRLEQFGLAEQTEAINRKAVAAVRKAVGDRAYVSASVGPCAHMLPPAGDANPEEVRASFLRQIRALIEEGADMICIETMMDAREATLALEAVRSIAPRIPAMATMTFGRTSQGYFTLMGSSVAEAARALWNAGADIVGSNCGEGSDNMVEIAREFCRCSPVPVAIQSNAGLPEAAETGLLYPETPEYMAKNAAEMVKLGVQIVGGCCGTTPEHIRAIRRMLRGSADGRWT